MLKNSRQKLPLDTKLIYHLPAACNAIAIGNVDSLTTDQFLGAAKIYAQCLTGYFFSDGTVNKTFLCEYGQWVPSEEPCVGEW